MEGSRGKRWRARDMSGTEISFKSWPAEINHSSPRLTTVLTSQRPLKRQSQESQVREMELVTKRQGWLTRFPFQKDFPAFSSVLKFSPEITV